MIKVLDEFNFHPEISQSAGISLVFFSGPHCASCHHLRDLINNEFQLFVEHFSDFHVYEVKADQAGALVNEFNVFHLPSMFLYRDGKYHCELQAEANPQKIIEAIEQALSQPAEEEP